MYKLTVQGHFDAAHHLEGYSGKCANVHGHSFRYSIELKGTALNEVGMLIDFASVKYFMENQVEYLFDHVDLNTVRSFGSINPTAENLAKTIHDIAYAKLGGLYDKVFVKVSSVTVWESENCSATYTPD